MSDITEQQVIQYLKQHSDFFVNNPKLLHSLPVGSEQGDVVQLIDRKLQQLQNKNAHLADQLKTLVNNAKRSEGLMDRLFQLLTDLSMNAPHQQFVAAMVAFIQKDFPSDHFCLLLTDIKSGIDHPDIGYYTQEQRQLFAGFAHNPTPLSGRLPAMKMKALFGDSPVAQSAIVLPIGLNAKHGLMAFGSQDENKFHPDLASDVLQKLASILAAFFDHQTGSDAHQSGS